MNATAEEHGGERDTLPGREPRSLPPLVLAAPPPPKPSVAFAIGASMARERLLRRSLALSIVLGAALVLVAIFVERRVGSMGATTRALGATFRVVLPLVMFGMVSHATERDRLPDAVWPAARFGVSRRDVALGLVGATAGAGAFVGAALSTLTVLLAHGPADPPLARELVTCAWVGGLASAAWVGLFAFASTFFARGRGSWGALALDFLFGGSLTILGAVFPRGNALNLLGLGAPLGLSQQASSVLLGTMVFVLVLAAALRCRD